jgi:hypothetical protein
LTFLTLILKLLDEMLIDQKAHQEYLDFSGDLSSIHTSLEFARKVGFQGLVVHGTHLVQLALSVLFADFPELEIAQTRIDFVGILNVEQDFRINLVHEEDRVRIIIEVPGEIKVKIRAYLRSTESQTKGISALDLHELFRDLGQVSQYVGMKDPGDAAVFRQLEIFVENPPAKKVVHDAIRVKDHSFDGYTIRSTALVNRLVELEDEITKVIDYLSLNNNLSVPRNDDFVIVGFGTLGKVILQVLISLGFQKGYVLTSKPESAGNFIEKMNLPRGVEVGILKNRGQLPNSIGTLFYTSSAKIESETVENSDTLAVRYQTVYHDELIDLSSYLRFGKLFYPSTSYIDENIDGFRIYAEIKRDTENKIRGRALEDGFDCLILRLPPFVSRHHSVLMKTKGELSIFELSSLLKTKFMNWYRI